MCVACAMRCGWFAVNVLRNAFRVLRSDLKSYETVRTGSFCSGEKLEKSTPMQVKLTQLCAVFQCSYRPPRARSTFAIIYDSESGDQVQVVQCWVGKVQQRFRELIQEGA